MILEIAVYFWPRNGDENNVNNGKCSYTWAEQTRPLTWDETNKEDPFGNDETFGFDMHLTCEIIDRSALV